MAFVPLFKMLSYKSSYLFCGIFFISLVCSISALKSGPFISTLVRAEKCKDPSPPYQKDLSGDVTVQLYYTNKKPLLRGNYTAFKPDAGLKLTVQDYFLVNGEWQQTFRISSMSCRGRIVAMIGQMFDIKFDKKTCSVPKGAYVFSNVDYDLVDHVFVHSREYGRVLRKVVVASKMGTSVCLEFESVVTAKTQ